MQSSPFTLAAGDGIPLHVHRWLPDGMAPRAAVQIVHGLSEHAGRYARLAEALTADGLAVYASDLRGHGLTARNADDLGFFAEREGWRKCQDDLWTLTQRLKSDLPGLPVVLFGHSLGSMLAQTLLPDHGDAFAGCALSATDGKLPPIAPIGRLIALVEGLRLGRKGRSPLLNAMLFGAFNKPFAPARTAFDWLSRDPAEIDKYVADPLCGGIPSVQLMLDMVEGLGAIADPRLLARIPKDLPLYLFRGERDPVGGNFRNLLAAFEAAGLTHVLVRTYPDGRHESLNEINRDQVTRDLLDWINSLPAVLAGRPS